MILQKNMITPSKIPASHYIKDYSKKRNIFYDIIKSDYEDNLQVFIFNRDFDEHSCTGLDSIVEHGEYSIMDESLTNIYRNSIFFICRQLSVNEEIIKEHQRIHNIRIYKDRKKDSFHDRFLVIRKSKLGNTLLISENDTVYLMGNGISVLGHQSAENNCALTLSRYDINTLLDECILNNITKDLNKIINNSICIYNDILAGDNNE